MSRTNWKAERNLRLIYFHIHVFEQLTTLVIIYGLAYFLFYLLYL
jgi:hypothetical protein